MQPAAGVGGSAASSHASVCARFQTLARSEVFRAAYKDLVAQWPHDDTAHLPMVYHDRYNISFLGLEKLHPFDSCKFSKVVKSLTSKGLVTHSQLVTPLQASKEALADVHTEKYLHEIHTSNLRVVQVTELPALTILPNFLLQARVVTPMKFHVGGTMLAAGLALQHGWAVNLGGGMHHAHSSAGGGWCPFDDVMLAVRRLRTASGGAVSKVVYVDLDAHQGNGVERDKLKFGDSQLFIVDLYNGKAYPWDEEAKEAINVDKPLASGTSDTVYLKKLQAALAEVHKVCPQPDLVFYNAGTDVLAGDPLGRLGVSKQGVITRDEVVWDWALHTARAPLVMTLSGGYTPASADVISESLANLMQRYQLGRQCSSSNNNTSSS